MSRPAFAIVVRAAGERTEPLACRLACAQGAAEVAVVHEVPFRRAVRASFERGLEIGCPWTFCLDADCLLAPGAAARCLDEAVRVGPGVFRVSPRGAWRFHQAVLNLGFHGYPTDLLREGLRVLEDTGPDLKPESAVRRRMQEAGYRFALLDTVAGLHEYELGYADIYRRMRVRACKATRREYALLLRLAKRSRQTDPDYRVVHQALRDARLRPIDRHGLDALSREEVDAALARLGLNEKAPLSPAAGFERVTTVLDAFRTAKEARDWERFFLAHATLARPPRGPATDYAHGGGTLTRFWLWLTGR